MTDKPKFIGTKQIAHIEQAENPDLEKVVFADGSFEEFNPEIREVCQSEKPTTDYTGLLQRRVTVTAKAILAVLKRYNLRIKDIDPLFSTLIASIQESDKNATAYVWRREGEKVREMDNRSFADIDRVLQDYERSKGVPTE